MRQGIEAGKNMALAAEKQLALPIWQGDSLREREVLDDSASKADIQIYNADVLSLYDRWLPPVVIISDGAYGLGLFKGDPHSPEELPAWYEPHIKAWSEKATPQTTLWFWNSEIGWANVHPILVKYGWKYVNCHIWDKGISHIAGNSNTRTLRKFPVVTEICVQYVREARINGMSLQQWLRSEWQRSGLPFSKANEACGVKNAATRKYLTADHLWYFPPPEAFARLVSYANQHGQLEGRPYFSLDSVKPADAEAWEKMRSKFVCKPGVTNVWREPPLNGNERMKLGTKSAHLNQKPLSQMELIIESSSEYGDLIWEPFGGLCTAALAAYRLGRRCVSAEISQDFYKLALRRLQIA
jgi:site-specific DNA-methyltransferase (adenine-specific)